jgi:peroxiredoxin
LAVSPDKPSGLAESANEHDLGYTLLSDSAMEAARAFGVAYRVDEATREQLQGFGIDLESASGRDHHMLPVPSVFLVGAEGTIRFVYADPNYRQRIDPEVLMSVARAETDGSDEES